MKFVARDNAAHFAAGSGTWFGKSGTV